MDGALGAGETIAGKYRIQGPLGRGASGGTYAAEVIDSGAYVALKRFRLRGGAWKSLELFEREGRVLASLSHPSIPRFIDSFSIEEGDGGMSFYLVQAIAPGVSLSDFMERGGRFDELQVKGIAEQLLLILRYLHGCLPPVVHRDVKPANVIRSPEGQIFLVDFGAVHEGVSEGEVGGTTVVGTYGFMAPEQFRGVATAATDLFAVGATLVFLLTRKTPDQLPQKRLRVELPADLHLTKPFAAWLTRLLEPAPEDRFGSAAEALEALRDPRRMVPRGSRRRIAILAGVLGVSLAAAVPAFYFINKRFAVRSPSAGTQNAQRAPDSLAPLLKLYEPPTRSRYRVGEITHSVQAHTALVISIETSPDGNSVLTAGYDGVAKTWSSAALTLKQTFGGKGHLAGAAFAEEGRDVVTADASSIRLFNAETAAAVSSAPLASPAISLALSPDKKRAFIGLDNGGLQEFDIPSLKPGPALDRSSDGGRVRSLAVSPDGDSLLVGSHDGHVRTLSSSDLSSRGDLPIHTTGETNAIAFSQDGASHASVGDDGGVAQWTAAGRQPFVTYASTGEVWTIALRPKTQMYVTGGADHIVRWWAHDGSLLDYGGYGTPISSLAFDRDGRNLFVGLATGMLHVHTLEDPADREKIPKPHTPVKVAPTPASPSLAQRADAALNRYHGSRTDLAEAKKLADQALAANPNDTLALVVMAAAVEQGAYLVSNKYDWKLLDEAGPYLDRALASDSGFPRAHRQRARWFLAQSHNLEGDDHQRKLDDAKKELDLAGSTEPAKVDHLRSDIAYEEKDGAGAARFAERAIEESETPDELRDAYQSLHEAYRRIGRLEAADEIYKRLIELNPDSAWEKGNYAVFLYQTGRTTEALGMVEAAIRLMDYGAAHQIRASIYVEFGITQLWTFRDVNAARESFKKALDDNPRSADAAYGLVVIDALVAAAKGSPCETCAKGLDRVLKLDPKHAQALQARKALGN